MLRIRKGYHFNMCTLITMYRILSVAVPSTAVVNSISMGTPLSGCAFFSLTSSPSLIIKLFKIKSRDNKMKAH
jgi:hypothetical protein